MYMYIITNLFHCPYVSIKILHSATVLQHETTPLNARQHNNRYVPEITS